MKAKKKERGVIRVRVDWVCPHCATRNECWLDVSSLTYMAHSVQTCDCDEGGCDTPVVIRPHFTVDVEVHKIEGEEPQAHRLEAIHAWRDEQAQRV